MASYITAVNQLIAERVAAIPTLVLYGENINNGSHISGLTKNLEVQESGRILNVGNCEATHCGFGFGLMMSGVSSVLFAKQLDFMLLGIEHFVNTYNFIRSHFPPNSLGSFTIVTLICDQGFQGPQSSTNALGDICSLARVPGYSVTNRQDVRYVLATQLGKPGFRFIGLSQRLFPTEFMNLETVYVADDSSVFQYTQGSDVTIVCFNFSLPEGYALHEQLSRRGISSSLFSVNQVPKQNWDAIKKSVGQTRKLIVMDDSKSVNLSCYALLHEIEDEFPSTQKIVVTRETNIDFGVCPDNFQIDHDAIIARLGTRMAARR